ncbi:hypothetical protein [Pseudaminobacter soli (ex Li et al. 2025)]|uniref:Uncharacterized protein n=1 Tax=Pseudaminobacter soli (ex Li et al. 2025) TaxID=1295366 RepID=A0A2P7S586_9HYPH|nr:hypothetical protein [Mesorhizobium soli]PSJ57634.1 hypothetical protein C7I85_22010 [Mesorhizobium soli]
MKKRETIYTGLLAFVAAGILIDRYFWGLNPPPLSLNDLIQIVGIVCLIAWWQIEDAEAHGFSRSRAASLATALLPPLGLAIYLFQARRWTWAITGFVAFWAGVTLVAVVADYLGLTLFANG